MCAHIDVSRPCNAASKCSCEKLNRVLEYVSDILEIAGCKENDTKTELSTGNACNSRHWSLNNAEIFAILKITRHVREEQKWEY